MLSTQFEYNDGLKKTRSEKNTRNEMHVFLLYVLPLMLVIEKCFSQILAFALCPDYQCTVNKIIYKCIEMANLLYRATL